MDPKNLRAFAKRGQKQNPDPKAAKPGADPEIQEGGEDKLGQLTPILEEAAGDIESAAESMTTLPDEVFGAEEPEQAWEDEAASTMDELDEDVQDALKPLSGISADDAHELAQHLMDEGMVDDAEAVAAWLYLVGCHMAKGGDQGDDSEDDEDLEDGGADEDAEGEY